MIPTRFYYGFTRDLWGEITIHRFQIVVHRMNNEFNNVLLWFYKRIGRRNHTPSAPIHSSSDELWFWQGFTHVLQGIFGGRIIVHRSRIIVHRVNCDFDKVWLRFYKGSGRQNHSSSAPNHSSSDELWIRQGFTKVLQGIWEAKS